MLVAYARMYAGRDKPVVTKNSTYVFFTSVRLIRRCYCENTQFGGFLLKSRVLKSFHVQIWHPRKRQQVNVQSESFARKISEINKLCKTFDVNCRYKTQITTYLKLRKQLTYDTTPQRPQSVHRQAAMITHNTSLTVTYASAQ